MPNISDLRCLLTAYCSGKSSEGSPGLDGLLDVQVTPVSVTRPIWALITTCSNLIYCFITKCFANNNIFYCIYT